MKGYIEEGALVSCTFDTSGVPQKLIKASDRLVKYSNGDRLLTEQDKVIELMFPCKIPAKQWGGLLALIGGIAVGLAMVLSGPVGWIALGALAVVAIGTTVAICTHDCSAPLKAGKWIKYHDTVKIKGDRAILYNQSLLTCDKGGLLLASETPAIAQSVSDSMKWNARNEVAVQILSNFVVGLITGRGIYDKVKGKTVDKDWATGFLGIGAYIQADFVHYKDWDPEDSLKAGLGWSAGNYALGSAYRIPGLKQPFWKNIGTELSWTDLKTTALSTAAGYGGDKIEEYLQNSNSVLKNGVLTEGKLTNALNSKASSGKKIISKDY